MNKLSANIVNIIYNLSNNDHLRLCSKYLNKLISPQYFSKRIYNIKFINNVNKYIYIT
jgi:hypothetical protein